MISAIRVKWPVTNQLIFHSLCRVGHLSHTVNIFKKCYIVVSQPTWVSHKMPLKSQYNLLTKPKDCRWQLYDSEGKYLDPLSLDLHSQRIRSHDYPWFPGRGIWQPFSMPLVVYDFFGPVPKTVGHSIYTMRETRIPSAFDLGGYEFLSWYIRHIPLPSHGISNNISFLSRYYTPEIT